MSEVWMTHPNLTAAHDVKVPRGGVGAKLSSGWQVRKDQRDPAPVDVPADPRGPRLAPPTPADVPADPRPARTPAPPVVDEPVNPRPPTPAAPQTPAPSGLSSPSPLPRDLKES